MAKLNIEYDTIDCDCSDKIVVIKIPEDLHYDDRKIAIKIANKIKDLCNAKSTLIISDIFDYKLLDQDTTVNMINAYIENLNKLKEDLLENDEE